MKPSSNIFILILLLGICGCGNTNTNAQKGSNLDEIINTYDPILSSLQYYYRIWLEGESQKVFNQVELLEPKYIQDLSYIEANIEHLMSSIDTVKSYLKDMAYVAVEYGNKLEATIRDTNTKMDFRAKWREYNEGVAKVMSYDIESIIKFANVFYFLRDNRTQYEVEDNIIYFLDDASLEEYKKLLNLAGDQKSGADQEAERIKTIQSFSDALNLVKDRD